MNEQQIVSTVAVYYRRAKCVYSVQSNGFHKGLLKSISQIFSLSHPNCNSNTINCWCNIFHFVLYKGQKTFLNCLSEGCPDQAQIVSRKCKTFLALSRVTFSNSEQNPETSVMMPFVIMLFLIILYQR